MTLASLRRGQKGVIRAIDTADPMVQRLMVLGLVEGAEVAFASAAIGGDPLEFRLFGSAISLRKEHARHFRSSPTGVFAIAVFSGLSASVGLLLKKAWCGPLFMTSLIAVIVQFGYWLGVADAIEVHGTEAYYMPLIVTIIAVFLVWYSRGAKAKDWLS